MSDYKKSEQVLLTTSGLARRRVYIFERIPYQHVGVAVGVISLSPQKGRSS